MELYFDGASKGNPGNSGCGWCLKKSDEEDFSEEGYKYLGTKTNNEAEYNGLIEGLKYYVESEYKKEPLKVYGDSKLVIQQMKGDWKVNKENIKVFWKEAVKLQEKIKKVEFIHIDRGLNKKADSLANKAVALNT